MKLRWQRVNSEPCEYAIQQGPHGDEFVKLLDGSCLERHWTEVWPLPDRSLVGKVWRDLDGKVFATLDGTTAGIELPQIPEKN